MDNNKLNKDPTNDKLKDFIDRIYGGYIKCSIP
jgi:hypothetical protein